MKIGVKLFPGCIVALLLGVFLAAPLLYTNVVVAPDTDVSELFGVEVVYAYIERQNTTTLFAPPEKSDVTSNDTILKKGKGDFDFTYTTINVPSVQRFIGINFTRLSEEVIPCDAKLEVYLIKFYSDKGFIGSLQRFEGFYTPVMYDSIGPLDMNEFFGDRPPSGGGSAYTNWDVGESRLGCSSGGGTNWVPTFGEPEAIFISVNRLGWISINGDSRETVVLSEPEVVAEAQLEKFGDGFLYNALIPEDELSGLDPLNPYWKLFDLKGNLN